MNIQPPTSEHPIDLPAELEDRFNLPENHSLTLSQTNKNTVGSTVTATTWFEEYDEANTLVSRYRTWTNRSLKPPYRSQIGWEKFSLSGQLLDREVRYSRRSDLSYLH